MIHNEISAPAAALSGQAARASSHRGRVTESRAAHVSDASYHQVYGRRGALVHGRLRYANMLIFREPERSRIVR